MFSQFVENSVNNQGPHSQTENDETQWGKYLNENDSEDTETNKNSAIPHFVPQALPDGEIAADINSINSKQKEVFNMVHIWAKHCEKYGEHDVELMHIFVSGGGCTGKPHLVKVIYIFISNVLFYLDLQKYRR